MEAYPEDAVHGIVHAVKASLAAFIAGSSRRRYLGNDHVTMASHSLP
jgi:hypothetical protein